MKNKFSKSIFLFLSVLTLLCSVGFSASAKTTVKKDGILYNIGSKYASVVEYSGDATTLTIPKEVEGKIVNSIKDYAFWQNKTLTTIDIPSTVTSIGEAAFNECTALTKVVFPEGLKKIGNAAFWYCTNLQTVVLPASVKTFGNNVFSGCNSLTVYVEPDSQAEKYVSTISNLNVGYTKIVSLAASGISLSPGKSKTLEVAIQPDIVLNSKLKFSSADNSIATVNSKGKVKAVSCGKTTVTCMTTDGSDKSIAVSVKVLPPTVKSLKQTAAKTTYVKISWAAANDVDGYQVQKYNNETKKWETLGTTKKTAYTVKDLSIGTAVKLRVRSFKTIDKTTFYSEYSKNLSASTLNPSKVENVKGASSTTTSIKLKWDKLSSVSGYNIYCYDKVAQRYNFIGNSEKNSFSIENLSPNSGYIFAVKSFIKNGSKTTESADFSDPAEYATCPTSTELELDASSQFSTRLSLTWAEKKTVSGYELACKKTGDSEWTTVKIEPTETSYSFNSLLPMTEYSFRIRTYTERAYKTFYSPYSKTVKASTNDLPSDNEEALNMFLNAFNALKNDTSNSILLFTEVSTSDRKVEPESEQCESILDALPMNYSKQYNIENGQVLGKNITLSSLIAPEVSEAAVSTDDVEVAFNYDGSGFRIKLTLPEEGTSAPILSSFAPLPNWTRAGNTKTFTLNTLKYSNATIEAKIQDGIISDIVISIPVEADINVSGNIYELGEVITYNYVVTYFD